MTYDHYLQNSRMESERWKLYFQELEGFSPAQACEKAGCENAGVASDGSDCPCLLDQLDRAEENWRAADHKARYWQGVADIERSTQEAS